MQVSSRSLTYPPNAHQGNVLNCGSLASAIIFATSHISPIANPSPTAKAIGTTSLLAGASGHPRAHAASHGSSFAGSYFVAAKVIAPNMRSGRAQAAVAMQVLKAQQNGEALDHQGVVEGSGLDSDVTAEIVKQATAEDGFKEAKVVGVSEEEDMKSIREMGEARKRNSERLEDLSEAIPELTK